MLKYSFWTDAFERAVKTAAQAMLVFLGADVVNAFTVDYQQAAGVSLGAAVVSLLTSLASSGVGTKGTASLAASANGSVSK